MKITYDKEIDAAYIYLGESNSKVQSTDSFSIKDRIPFGDINIDFTTDGKIKGLEVLNASRYLEENFYKKYS